MDCCTCMKGIEYGKMNYVLVVQCTVHLYKGGVILLTISGGGKDILTFLF